MKEGYLQPRRLRVKLSTFAENHPYNKNRIIQNSQNKLKTILIQDFFYYSENSQIIN